MALRSALRDRLAGLHARLDAAVAGACFAETLRLAPFLAMHHRALGAIVPALESAGAASLFPGWDGRPRLAALDDDLASLGAAPPPAAPRLVLANQPEAWGALYAAEGSRLGNRVLLHRVRQRGEARDRAATRFLADAPEARAAWPQLVMRLDALPYRGQDHEAVVRGGEKVFRAYLETVPALDRCIQVSDLPRSSPDG